LIRARQEKRSVHLPPGEEQAFGELKHSLSVRPIHRQKEHRIEAHILLSFIVHCLHVTLKSLVKPHAFGLIPRKILEKFDTMQLVDVHPPTSDGRCLFMPRHTQPSKDHPLLLHPLDLKLPDHPRPRLRI